MPTGEDLAKQVVFIITVFTVLGALVGHFVIPTFLGLIIGTIFGGVISFPLGFGYIKFNRNRSQTEFETENTMSF